MQKHAKLEQGAAQDMFPPIGLGKALLSFEGIVGDHRAPDSTPPIDPMVQLPDDCGIAATFLDGGI